MYVWLRGFLVLQASKISSGYVVLSDGWAYFGRKVDRPKGRSVQRIILRQASSLCCFTPSHWEPERRSAALQQSPSEQRLGLLSVINRKNCLRVLDLTHRHS